MAKHETYTLQIGKKAKERLLILNSVCNPFTLSLLNSLSDFNNKSVLDVACGIGVMTCEFGQLVGKNGRVVGIDISEEQLEIAKKFTKQHHCNNISYRICSAANLDSLGEKFDVIYCRFLLAHLHNPLEIIEKMIEKLKSKGILILEEPTGYEPMFSYPPSVAFDECKRIHLLQPQAFNTDFTVGKKLCHWLQKLQLSVMQDRLVQPLLKTEYEKRQLWLGPQEMAAKLIEKGLITAPEIKRIITSVKKYAKNDKYQTAFVQYRQIVAKNCNC